MAAAAGEAAVAASASPSGRRAMTDVVDVFPGTGPVPCADHPDVETRLRCSRCGRPICPRCGVRTPVGMRCPDCAGTRSSVAANPAGTLTAAGAGLAVATAAGLAWGFFPDWQFYWALLLGFGTVETMVRLLTKRQGLDLQAIAIAIVVYGIVLSRVVLAQRLGDQPGRDRELRSRGAARALPAAGAGSAVRVVADRHRLDSVPLTDAVRFVAAEAAPSQRWPANTSPRRLASAQISRIGAPLTRLSRRQSSYSGMAPMTRPSQPRSLSRTSPQRVVTVSNRRGARVRLTGVARTPMVVLSTKEGAFDLVAAVRGDDGGDDRRGPALLHRDRGEPDVERPRREETLAQRFDRTAGSCRRCSSPAGAPRLRWRPKATSRRPRAAARSAREARACQSHSRRDRGRMAGRSSVASVPRMAAPVGVRSSPACGPPGGSGRMGTGCLRQKDRGGRGGDGEQTVVRAHPARSDGDGVRAICSTPSACEPGAGADDVDDGVDSADLMEVHAVRSARRGPPPRPRQGRQRPRAPRRGRAAARPIPRAGGGWSASRAMVARRPARREPACREPRRQLAGSRRDTDALDAEPRDGVLDRRQGNARVDAGRRGSCPRWRPRTDRRRRCGTSRAPPLSERGGRICPGRGSSIALSEPREPCTVLASPGEIQRRNLRPRSKGANQA